MIERDRRRIVVGVDGSAGGVEAARWAAGEARLHRRHVQLVCVYSWPALVPLAQLPSQWTEESLRAGAEAAVADAVAVVRAAAPEVGVTSVALPGLAAYTLIEMSSGTSMVVVGHRGHGGFAALRLGAVAAKVAAYAQSPVVVVRPGAGDRALSPAIVLVGADGSPASEAAVGVAFEEADRRGGAVRALHSWELSVLPWRGEVWPPLPDHTEVEAAVQRRLHQWIQPWQDKHPRVTVEQRVTGTRPAAALIEAASDATLLVVGSRGHEGFAGLLLGSVSQQVIHHAPCPVVVVR
jgi:nucleotide-binding universal stress UspA family protein